MIFERNDNKNGQILKRMNNSLDCHMSKTVVFGISRMDLELWVVLRSIIVSQLECHSIHVPKVIMSFLRSWSQFVFLSLRKGRQEVKTESKLRKVKLVNQGKAEKIRVERDAFGRILDSQHGLLPCWSAWNNIG